MIMKKTLFAVALAAFFAAPSFAGEEHAVDPNSTVGKVVNSYKLSGFVMARYNAEMKKEAGNSNSFSLRLARVQVDGRILDDFNYRLQIQVNGTSNSIAGPHIVDAYVEWQKFKPFYVKVGQFKRAFTFENPMNPIDQGFYGYSKAIDKLASIGTDRVGEHTCNGRDIGIQFQGDLFPDASGRPWLHYQIGLYNGQGINVKDVNPQKDIIGGIWVMPVSGMRIGVFGWDGRYGRGDVRVPRKRYAISGEYKFDDYTFRSEYVHSYGPAFSEAYGSSSTALNEALGYKADAFYAMAIVPIEKNVCHVKARYDLYRADATWENSYAAYDLGVDYMFTRNLVISAVASYVYDRSINDKYLMGDVQVSFRF